jgi:hypothetical protein
MWEFIRLPLQVISQQRWRDIKHGPMLCRANTEGFDDIDGEDDDGFDWWGLLHVTSFWEALVHKSQYPH